MMRASSSCRPVFLYKASLFPFLSFLGRIFLFCPLLAGSNAFAAATFISLSIGAQIGSVSYGGGTVTYTVTGTATGNGNGSCGPLTANDLPAGVSGAFVPTSLSRNGAGTATATLTLTITASKTPVSGALFTVSCLALTSNNGALTVSPAPLTITASNASKTYGQTPTLTAFTSSGLKNGETIGSVSETSPGTAANASVAGSPYAITPSAATGGTFTASNYSISYVNGSLTVTPASQAITFGAAPSIGVGGTGMVGASGGGSGNQVTFTSTTPAVCTSGGSNGATITGVTAGDCTIAVNQAGDGNYDAAPQVSQTFGIGKLNQTITLGAAPSVVVGGTGTMSASGGGSGNPVTFSSSTPAVCTAGGSHGATITGVTVGSCSVAADQAGNASYNAAPQVTQTFAIGNGNQTISFGAAPSIVVGSTGTVSASGGGSGNPVTFTSTTPAVCTSGGSNGATITGVTGGSCTIAADQAGNADYNAAAQVSQTFGISAAMPTVTTGSASAISPWAEQLNGTVSSNGAVTTVYFEYGLTTLYGSSITADQSPLGAAASNAAVSAELDGLNCASTFHYRAVAVNSTGLTNGADQSFSTGSCIAPFPVNACSATRFGQNLGCTANDVRLSTIAVAPGSSSFCISGTPVTLDLDLTVNFGSAKRYDVGIFVANDGKLPTLLATSGGAGSCSVAVLPTSLPFLDLDGVPKGTADSCGDGDAGVTGIYRMTSVTLPCYASPSSGGKLYVPYTLSWDNQASPIGGLCISNLYPVSTTSSKCNVPANTVSIEVVVLPKINKSHSGASFNSGDSISYSVVAFNDSGGVLQPSTLTDPAVTGLSVSSVTCATANGSTCPTTSKALIQGSGIAIPSANFPNNSSLIFTISGSLSGNIGDTISNSATITIGSNARSSTDSVTLGSASGAKSFAPSVITEGNNSLMTITFSNPTAFAVSGVAFTDSYPAGLVNSASPNASSSCGGTATAAAGGATLVFSDGTVPALGNCAVSVNVTSDSANSYVNAVTFSSGIVGSTSATLSVSAAVFGRFNACNVATAPNAACTASSSPYTGRLGSKLAGSAFNLDLVALNTNGSRNTSYANTVVVELLDASNNSGVLDGYNCRSSWTSVIATLSPNPVFASGNSGLKTVGPFTVASAYRDVRVRITQSGSSTIKGCSTDDFAIRPTGFALSSSNANADSSGSSTSATPVIKAGVSFSLTATALAGYGGTPLINPVGVTAHAGAVQTGALTGTFGAANSGNGIATGSAFSYSEVGYLGFNPNAIYDDTFTAVDLPSDCSNDFSNTAVNALFGCKFGNTAISYFGRFTPASFSTTVTKGCVGGGFTYSGQTMGVMLSAYNALPVPTVTRNYDGSAVPVFAKDVTLSAWDAALGTSANPGPGALTPSQPPAIVAKSAFSAGVATVGTPVYSFDTKLTAPTSIRLRGVDSDNVSSQGFAEGTTEIRSGRLRLSNIFGSEKSDLTMALQAQYWSGQSWILNSADSCTSLPANAFALSGTLAANTGASAVTLSGGSGTLTLAKPNPVATGSVSVAANLGVSGSDQSCLLSHGGTAANLSWLRSQNGNCAATFDRDPSARATFGIYAPEIRKTVHVRELY